jgi:hypothetical protein
MSPSSHAPVLSATCSFTQPLLFITSTLLVSGHQNRLINTMAPTNCELVKQGLGCFHSGTDDFSRTRQPPYVYHGGWQAAFFGAAIKIQYSCMLCVHMLCRVMTRQRAYPHHSAYLYTAHGQGSSRPSFSAKQQGRVSCGWRTGTCCFGRFAICV